MNHSFKSLRTFGELALFRVLTRLHSGWMIPGPRRIPATSAVLAVHAWVVVIMPLTWYATALDLDTAGMQFLVTKDVTLRVFAFGHPF
jgi:hypothetical protein